MVTWQNSALWFQECEGEWGFYRMRLFWINNEEIPDRPKTAVDRVGPACLHMSPIISSSFQIQVG